MIFSDQLSYRNHEISKIMFFYQRMDKFDRFMAFQVYFDLCFNRRWINVRLIFNYFLNLYFILALNPKKKKKNLELFIPIKTDYRLISRIKKKILKFTFQNIDKKHFDSINLAFIAEDSSIVYYVLTFNFHKALGPSV